MTFRLVQEARGLTSEQRRAFLAAFFGWSHSFGHTYGPLAGMVALLIWLMLVSVSVMFGAAVAAQLEAVRAGVPQPQDLSKATESITVDASRAPAAA